MNVVVEAQYLLTEGKLAIGLAKLDEPLFVVLKTGTRVAQVLADMTFYLVDERLDIQLVNLFGYKGLVVSQGCNDTLCQGKSFVTRIKTL